MNQKKVIALLSILILNASCLRASKEYLLQSTNTLEGLIKKSSDILEKKDPFGCTLTYIVKLKEGALEIIEESNGSYNARFIHVDQEKSEIRLEKDQAKKLFGIALARISTIKRHTITLKDRRFNEAA